MGLHQSTLVLHESSHRTHPMRPSDCRRVQYDPGIQRVHLRRSVYDERYNSAYYYIARKQHAVIWRQPCSCDGAYVYEYATAAERDAILAKERARREKEGDGPTEKYVHRVIVSESSKVEVLTFNRQSFGKKLRDYPGNVVNFGGLGGYILSTFS